MLRRILAIACLIAGALCAETVQFDPAHTKVEFTLGDVLHTVHGTFHMKSGAVRFDPATGKASGRIVIDAATGNSGSGARDKRMHNNILETATYPEITFSPESFEGKLSPYGESHLEVRGKFGIHGVEHEMVLPFDVRQNADVLSAKTHFAVPYVKWGMKNPSTLFLRVKDTVQIDIDAIGRITAATLSRM